MSRLNTHNVITELHKHSLIKEQKSFENPSATNQLIILFYRFRMRLFKYPNILHQYCNYKSTTFFPSKITLSKHLKTLKELFFFCTDHFFFTPRKDCSTHLCKNMGSNLSTPCYVQIILRRKKMVCWYLMNSFVWNYHWV